MPRRSDAKLNLSIGRRIRRIRELRGLTQAQLAEAAGLQPVSISRLEAGERAVSVANLARLADALSTQLGDLVDDGRPIAARHIDSEEAELLTSWRSLGQPQQALLRQLILELRKS